MPGTALGRPTGRRPARPVMQVPGELEAPALAARVLPARFPDPAVLAAAALAGATDLGRHRPPGRKARWERPRAAQVAAARRVPEHPRTEAAAARRTGARPRAAEHPMTGKAGYRPQAHPQRRRQATAGRSPPTLAGRRQRAPGPPGPADARRREATPGRRAPPHRPPTGSQERKAVPGRLVQSWPSRRRIRRRQSRGRRGGCDRRKARRTGRNPSETDDGPASWPYPSSPWDGCRGCVPRRNAGRRPAPVRLTGQPCSSPTRAARRAPASGLASSRAPTWACVPRRGSRIGTRCRVSCPGTSKITESQLAAET